METVTVKGKVYQIGEWYLNDRDEACSLIGHGVDGFEVDINGMLCQSHELAVIETVGTITDAPIELEDGEWYMCDLASGKSVLTWDQDTETWLYSDGDQFQEVENTPIPLFKMVRERT